MSDDSLLLSPAEIIELTGKQRKKAQTRVLRALGVRYSPRPDGSLIVGRAALARLLGHTDKQPPASKPAAVVVNLDVLESRRKPVATNGKA